MCTFFKIYGFEQIWETFCLDLVNYFVRITNAECTDLHITPVGACCVRAAMLCVETAVSSLSSIAIARGSYVPNSRYVNRLWTFKSAFASFFSTSVPFILIQSTASQTTSRTVRPCRMCPHVQSVKVVIN